MSDKNVFIVSGDLSPIASFENVAEARKAFRNGTLGEGSYSLVTLHEKATLAVAQVAKVQVTSETFRSRAPRKPKAAPAAE